MNLKSDIFTNSLKQCTISIMELDKIVQVTNIFSFREKLKIAYDLFFSPYVEFFVPSPLNVLREGKKKKEIEPVSAQIE